jgi:MarR family transcriptional regulator, temperature-dependent positive regulator of motility
MISDDMRYRLMRLLKANPGMSQRDVARELGISLGKVNYCLRSLVERGWIKATRFTNSRNKAAYLYLLTARGIDAKARITMRFLRSKMLEYEALKIEISQIRHDAEQDRTQASGGAREQCE